MISLVVFLFGLSVGSFLNAFIYRLEAQQGLRSLPPLRTPGVRSGSHPRGGTPSVTEGRSFCPSCGHTLGWQDIIPLLSFALLKGKCRYCKKKISFQYPLIELAVGALFPFILFAVHGTSVVFSFAEIFALLYLWIIASLLVVIFIYDLKHFIIPDKVLLPATGIVLFWRLFEQLEFGILNLFRISNFEFWISLPLIQAIAAGVGASLFFFAVYAFSGGRAMGFGDVKLALFMGLFLSWPNILIALFVAFFTGATVGVVLMFLKRKTMRSEVPFGPFLLLGLFTAFFWGERLVDFYLSSLGV
ncbi:MAG: prepilin peptidase [bacterium]|nr:prepilin peptidase [bacterium]